MKNFSISSKLLRIVACHQLINNVKVLPGYLAVQVSMATMSLVIGNIGSHVISVNIL